MPVAPALDFTTFFTRASAHPAPTAAIVVTGVWYLWSAARSASRGRRWPWPRTVSFLVAELLLAASLLSGLASLSGTSFKLHAIQDIGVAVVAPVFVVLAAPVSLLLQSAPGPVRGALSRAVYSRAGRILSHPLVGLPIYGASLFVFYFSGLYADSLTDPVLHGFVQLELLATACLFFWPLADVDALPRRSGFGTRILALLLALPLYGILGMALESQSAPLFRGNTLADLHSGAGLIWLVGDAVCLIGAIAVFCLWLGADERQAKSNDRLNEAAAAQQLALWRATREAAARAASSS